MASKVGSGPPPPVVAVGTGGALGSAAAASPSSSSAPTSSSAECCMCGDHGLARELFRCRTCHFRYQHKYCSDLYPKAESYRTCNWCLREEAGAGAATANKSSTAKHTNNHSPSSHLSPTSFKKDHHNQPLPSNTATTEVKHRSNNSHSLSSSSTSTADNNSTGSTNAGNVKQLQRGGEGNVKQLQRGGDYTAHLLAKPLKKLRPTGLERSASEVIVRVKAAEEMGAPPPVASRRLAGGGAVRGKIRRYKLLEEVSS